MKNINGQGNEITIILPHKKIDCISSHHEQFNQIIHQSHIIITGNNNHISMHFDSVDKNSPHWAGYTERPYLKKHSFRIKVRTRLFFYRV